ncbi:MAG: hypothetical protein ACRDDZ_06070 [Marinifilaceae bacterium]
MNDMRSFSTIRVFQYIAMLWRILNINRLILIMVVVYIGCQVFVIGPQRNLPLPWYYVTPPLSLEILNFSIIVFMAVLMLHLNSTHKRVMNLHVPLSLIERYIAIWLLTFVICGTIVFVIINTLGYLFQFYYCYIDNVKFIMINPFTIFFNSYVVELPDGNTIESCSSGSPLLELLTIHSFLFMGGYLFRHNSMMKTLLFIIVLFLSIRIIGGGITLPNFSEDLIRNLDRIGNQVKYLLPFLFYTVAYLRLRRQEI